MFGMNLMFDHEYLQLIQLLLHALASQGVLQFARQNCRGVDWQVFYEIYHLNLVHVYCVEVGNQWESFVCVSFFVSRA